MQRDAIVLQLQESIPAGLFKCCSTFVVTQGSPHSSQSIYFMQPVRCAFAARYLLAVILLCSCNYFTLAWSHKSAMISGLLQGRLWRLSKESCVTYFPLQKIMASIVPCLPLGSFCCTYSPFLCYRCYSVSFGLNSKRYPIL